MFKKILVANRGEISVRVIRACQDLGIASVAVYSDVDRAASHVMLADEAYRIGSPPASESYLNIQNILQAARNCGADAIHPGYGFLSENPRFARACEEVGIKFIGPSAAAMEVMGSKTRARQKMEEVGVPFVPGTSRGIESQQELARKAGELGYPVMLKAAAGGGGKGMRLVASEAELHSAFETAQSEASRAFGSDEVYIEKAIVNPRHIEVQILADEFGNTVFLGERDCSLQRRHQKVVEEAPSPVMTRELRQRMGEVAVRAARAAGYANAGTVEFLVDSNRNFYFLEMNTRLQVEHPVTELVTGLDLVQLQIRIAAGEKLPFSQADISIRGHAIECRIYAEDPENNYFPSPGKITGLAEPSGPGVRLDSGIYEGWTVPIEYDPLLAKLIVHGQNREQAVARLKRALDEYFVAGVKTNISLFRRILADKGFLEGNFDTGTLARLPQAAAERTSAGEHEVAAIAACLFRMVQSREDAQPTENASSPWKKVSRIEALR